VVPFRREVYRTVARSFAKFARWSGRHRRARRGLMVRDARRRAPHHEDL